VPLFSVTKPNREAKPKSFGCEAKKGDFSLVLDQSETAKNESEMYAKRSERSEATKNVFKAKWWEPIRDPNDR
jgi:hypothetical protein